MLRGQDRQMKMLCLIVFLLLIVSGCGHSRKVSSNNPNGYYQDDGPPAANIGANYVEDAVPVREPLSKGGNRTYTVRGKTYHPDIRVKRFRETGEASWYGKKYHGRQTSNGEIYSMFEMTAAHKTLPLPSYVRVTNQTSVVVRVNDRGPFINGRIVDLSYVAAKKIGLDKSGIAPVKLELILAPTTP